jgi:hypothetical protein
MGPYEKELKAPEILSAEATSSTEVLVLFDEEMSETTCNVAANYVIDNGVSVAAAALMADLRTVVLTVSDLDAANDYFLTVNHVTDTGDNEIVADFTIAFSVRGLRPTLLGATATSPSTIELVFSQEMEQTSAETIASYHIDTLTITAASLDGGDPTKVVLTVTEEMQSGASYDLTVSDVMALSGFSLETSSITFGVN